MKIAQVHKTRVSAVFSINLLTGQRAFGEAVRWWKGFFEVGARAKSFVTGTG